MPFRVYNSLSLMYKKNYVLNTPPQPQNYDCQPGHCPVLNIWWQARSLKFLVTLGMQTCDFNPWKYAALNWLGDILILLYMYKKETSSFYRSHLISENLVFLNEVFCIYIKVSSCTGLKKSLNLFILQFD